MLKLKTKKMFDHYSAYQLRHLDFETFTAPERSSDTSTDQMIFTQMVNTQNQTQSSSNSPRSPSKLSQSYSKKLITVRPSQKTRQSKISKAPTDLVDIFTKLTNDVSLLECEIIPLRARVLRLQNNILAAKGQLPLTDEQLGDDLAQKNQCFSGPNELQQADPISNRIAERNELTFQLRQAKSAFSTKNLSILSMTVTSERDSLWILQRNADKIQKEFDHIQQQMTFFKLSEVYGNVQIQKKQIEELKEKVKKEESENSHLKTEAAILCDPSNGSIRFYEEDARHIEKLTRKLNAARRHYNEVCQRRVHIREQQMNEIKAIEQQLNKPPISAVPSDDILPPLDFSSIKASPSILTQ